MCKENAPIEGNRSHDKPSVEACEHVHQDSHGRSIGSNEPLSEHEAQAYIDRGVERYGSSLSFIIAHVDDTDEIELYHHFDKQPFQRIRRITGYLVGDLDRFNDAKRAEVEDRVKHDMNMAACR